MAKERDNIPVRRFPQFVKENGWNYVNANELFEPIVNKNHNSDLPVLAITQDQGAVPREKIGYNVIVSEKSIAGYKVVEVGDSVRGGYPVFKIINNGGWQLIAYIPKEHMDQYEEGQRVDVTFFEKDESNEKEFVDFLKQKFPVLQEQK